MSFFSDEILMQYADGVLGESTRHALEMAMRSDPALAARVRQHQILRSSAFADFADSLDQVASQRQQAARSSGKVVQLNAARNARVPPPPRQPDSKPGWGWPQWSALAAALVTGVLAGAAGLNSLQRDSRLAVAGRDGTLMAQGTLATALSRQLGGSGGAVTIGVSFVAKDGGFCRSFALAGALGLACRNASGWEIPVMVQGDTHALQAAIESRKEGPVLDMAQVRGAVKQGWLK